MSRLRCPMIRRLAPLPHGHDTLDGCQQRGQMIGGNDLMIAAIALAHDLTLATHNGGEFRRVPDLRVEDWIE